MIVFLASVDTSVERAIGDSKCCLTAKKVDRGFRGNLLRQQRDFCFAKAAKR